LTHPSPQLTTRRLPRIAEAAAFLALICRILSQPLGDFFVRARQLNNCCYRSRFFFCCCCCCRHHHCRP